MHALIEQLTHWYEDVKQLETERLATLLSLGAKVTKLLEAKDAAVRAALDLPTDVHLPED